MAANLSHLYLHIVSDVINNVRPDFLNEGIDEAVLQELKSLWELKMLQSGTIQAGQSTDSQNGTGGHPPTAAVHDLNMPYEGETPTAELLFPPTPVHTPLPTQMPTPSFMVPIPSPLQEPIGSFGIGRPVSFMHPPWMNQRVGMNHNMDKLDMNVAYQTGDDEEAFASHFPITQDFLPTSAGKRKREDFFSTSHAGNFFPQFDGSGDIEGTKRNTEMEAWKSVKEEFEKRMGQTKQLQNRILPNLSSIPQYDGIGDNYYYGVEEEDFNEFGDEEQIPVDEVELKIEKCEAAESDESEPPLNEDDDLDDLDDIVQGDDEAKTENLVLAQFEKVTRSKNKWKCTLKDGVLHLQNRDFLFSRATGEFDF